MTNKPEIVWIKGLLETTPMANRSAKLSQKIQTLRAFSAEEAGAPEENQW
jgi:hypothetical protein